jgi:hypothetical protein
MKKMLVCAALLAIVGSAIAGGELSTRSSKQYYATRSEVAYVMPPDPVVRVPVQPTRVVYRERPGFFGYIKHRVLDVGDIFCSTFDAVVGIVTLDPEGDDW